MSDHTTPNRPPPPSNGWTPEDEERYLADRPLLRELIASKPELRSVLLPIDPPTSPPHSLQSGGGATTANVHVSDREPSDDAALAVDYDDDDNDNNVATSEPMGTLAEEGEEDDAQDKAVAEAIMASLKSANTSAAMKSAAAPSPAAPAVSTDSSSTKEKSSRKDKSHHSKKDKSSGAADETPSPSSYEKLVFTAPHRCRICQKSSYTMRNRMLQPCACKGSIGYGHEQCILKWMSKSESLTCAVCHTTIAASKLYDANAERPEDAPTMVKLLRAMRFVHQTLVKYCGRLAFAGSMWLLLFPLLTIALSVGFYGRATPQFAVSALSGAISVFTASHTVGGGANSGEEVELTVLGRLFIMWLFHLLVGAFTLLMLLGFSTWIIWCNENAAILPELQPMQVRGGAGVGAADPNDPFAAVDPNFFVDEDPAAADADGGAGAAAAMDDDDDDENAQTTTATAVDDAGTHEYDPVPEGEAEWEDVDDNTEENKGGLAPSAATAEPPSAPRENDVQSAAADTPAPTVDDGEANHGDAKDEDEDEGSKGTKKSGVFNPFAGASSDDAGQDERSGKQKKSSTSTSGTAKTAEEKAAAKKAKKKEPGASKQNLPERVFFDDGDRIDPNLRVERADAGFLFKIGAANNNAAIDGNGNNNNPQQDQPQQQQQQQELNLIDAFGLGGKYIDAIAFFFTAGFATVAMWGLLNAPFGVFGFVTDFVGPLALSLAGFVLGLPVIRSVAAFIGMIVFGFTPLSTTSPSSSSVSLASRLDTYVRYPLASLVKAYCPLWLKVTAHVSFGIPLLDEGLYMPPSAPPTPSSSSSPPTELEIEMPMTTINDDGKTMNAAAAAPRVILMQTPATSASSLGLAVGVKIKAVSNRRHRRRSRAIGEEEEGEKDDALPAAFSPIVFNSNKLIPREDVQWAVRNHSEYIRYWYDSHYPRSATEAEKKSNADLTLSSASSEGSDAVLSTSIRAPVATTFVSTGTIMDPSTVYVAKGSKSSWHFMMAMNYTRTTVITTTSSMMARSTMPIDGDDSLSSDATVVPPTTTTSAATRAIMRTHTTVELNSIGALANHNGLLAPSIASPTVNVVVVWIVAAAMMSKAIMWLASGRLEDEVEEAEAEAVVPEGAGADAENGGGAAPQPDANANADNAAAAAAVPLPPAADAAAARAGGFLFWQNRNNNNKKANKRHLKKKSGNVRMFFTSQRHHIVKLLAFLNGIVGRTLHLAMVTMLSGLLTLVMLSEFARQPFVDIHRDDLSDLVAASVYRSGDTQQHHKHADGGGLSKRFGGRRRRVTAATAAADPHHSSSSAAPAATGTTGLTIGSHSLLTYVNYLFWGADDAIVAASYSTSGGGGGDLASQLMGVGSDWIISQFALQTPEEAFAYLGAVDIGLCSGRHLSYGGGDPRLSSTDASSSSSPSSVSPLMAGSHNHKKKRNNFGGQTYMTKEHKGHDNATNVSANNATAAIKKGKSGQRRRQTKKSGAGVLDGSGAAAAGKDTRRISNLNFLYSLSHRAEVDRNEKNLLQKKKKLAAGDSKDDDSKKGGDASSSSSGASSSSVSLGSSLLNAIPFFRRRSSIVATLSALNILYNSPPPRDMVLMMATKASSSSSSAALDAEAFVGEDEAEVEFGMCPNYFDVSRCDGGVLDMLGHLAATASSSSVGQRAVGSSDDDYDYDDLSSTAHRHIFALEEFLPQQLPILSANATDQHHDAVLLAAAEAKAKSLLKAYIHAIFWTRVATLDEVPTLIYFGIIGMGITKLFVGGITLLRTTWHHESLSWLFPVPMWASQAEYIIKNPTRLQIFPMLKTLALVCVAIFSIAKPALWLVRFLFPSVFPFALFDESLLWLSAIIQYFDRAIPDGAYTKVSDAHSRMVNFFAEVFEVSSLILRGEWHEVDGHAAPLPVDPNNNNNNEARDPLLAVPAGGGGGAQPPANGNNAAAAVEGGADAPQQPSIVHSAHFIFRVACFTLCYCATWIASMAAVFTVMVLMSYPFAGLDTMLNGPQQQQPSSSSGGAHGAASSASDTRWNTGAIHSGHTAKLVDYLRIVEDEMKDVLSQGRALEEEESAMKKKTSVADNNGTHAKDGSNLSTSTAIPHKKRRFSRFFYLDHELGLFTTASSDASAVTAAGTNAASAALSAEIDASINALFALNSSSDAVRDGVDSINCSAGFAVGAGHIDRSDYSSCFYAALWEKKVEPVAADNNGTLADAAAGDHTNINNASAVPLAAFVSAFQQSFPSPIHLLASMLAEESSVTDALEAVATNISAQREGFLAAERHRREVLMFHRRQQRMTNTASSSSSAASLAGMGAENFVAALNATDAVVVDADVIIPTSSSSYPSDTAVDNGDAPKKMSPLTAQYVKLITGAIADYAVSPTNAYRLMLRTVAKGVAIAPPSQKTAAFDGEASAMREESSANTNVDTNAVANSNNNGPLLFISLPFEPATYAEWGPAEAFRYGRRHSLPPMETLTTRQLIAFGPALYRAAVEMVVGQHLSSLVSSSSSSSSTPNATIHASSMHDGSSTLLAAAPTRPFSLGVDDDATAFSSPHHSSSSAAAPAFSLVPPSVPLTSNARVFPTATNFFPIEHFLTWFPILSIIVIWMQLRPLIVPAGGVFGEGGFRGFMGGVFGIRWGARNNNNNNNRNNNDGAAAADVVAEQNDNDNDRDDAVVAAPPAAGDDASQQPTPAPAEAAVDSPQPQVGGDGAPSHNIDGDSLLRAVSAPLIANTTEAAAPTVENAAASSAAASSTPTAATIEKQSQQPLTADLSEKSVTPSQAEKEKMDDNGEEEDGDVLPIEGDKAVISNIPEVTTDSSLVTAAALAPAPSATASAAEAEDNVDHAPPSIVHEEAKNAVSPPPATANPPLTANTKEDHRHDKPGSDDTDAAPITTPTIAPSATTDSNAAATATSANSTAAPPADNKEKETAANGMTHDDANQPNHDDDVDHAAAVAAAAVGGGLPPVALPNGMDDLIVVEDDLTEVPDDHDIIGARSGINGFVRKYLPRQIPLMLQLRLFFTLGIWLSVTDVKLELLQQPPPQQAKRAGGGGGGAAATRPPPRKKTVVTSIIRVNLIGSFNAAALNKAPRDNNNPDGAVGGGGGLLNQLLFALFGAAMFGNGNGDDDEEMDGIFNTNTNDDDADHDDIEGGGNAAAADPIALPGAPKQKQKKKRHPAPPPYYNAEGKGITSPNGAFVGGLFGLFALMFPSFLRRRRALALLAAHDACVEAKEKALSGTLADIITVLENTANVIKAAKKHKAEAEAEAEAERTKQMKGITAEETETAVTAPTEVSSPSAATTTPTPTVDDVAVSTTTADVAPLAGHLLSSSTPQALPPVPKATPASAPVSSSSSSLPTDEATAANAVAKFLELQRGAAAAKLDTIRSRHRAARQLLVLLAAIGEGESAQLMQTDALLLMMAKGRETIANATNPSNAADAVDEGARAPSAFTAVSSATPTMTTTSPIDPRARLATIALAHHDIHHLQQIMDAVGFGSSLRSVLWSGLKSAVFSFIFIQFLVPVVMSAVAQTTWKTLIAAEFALSRVFCFGGGGGGGGGGRNGPSPLDYSASSSSSSFTTAPTGIWEELLFLWAMGTTVDLLCKIAVKNVMYIFDDGCGSDNPSTTTSAARMMDTHGIIAEEKRIASSPANPSPHPSLSMPSSNSKTSVEIQLRCVGSNTTDAASSSPSSLSLFSGISRGEKALRQQQLATLVWNVLSDVASSWAAPMIASVIFSTVFRLFVAAVYLCMSSSSPSAGPSLPMSDIAATLGGDVDADAISRILQASAAASSTSSGASASSALMGWDPLGDSFVTIENGFARTYADRASCAFAVAAALLSLMRYLGIQRPFMGVVDHFARRYYDEVHCKGIRLHNHHSHWGEQRARGHVVKRLRRSRQ